MIPHLRDNLSRLQQMPRVDPWQLSIAEFMHRAKTVGRHGDAMSRPTLMFRASLIRNEADELTQALEAEDFVGVCHELIDVAYVVLGTYCAAGVVADTRFKLLIDTANRRKGISADPLPGMTESVTKVHDNAHKLANMLYAWSGSVPFAMWDLARSCMNEIAHAFTACCVDPGPLFAAVHAANMAKEPASAVGLRHPKPAGWQAADIATCLHEQGWRG